MIVYKDMTFCTSDTCTNMKCFRHKINVEYKVDKFVAFANFEPTCTEYLPVRKSRTKKKSEQV